MSCDVLLHKEVPFAVMMWLHLEGKNPKNLNLGREYLKPNSLNINTCMLLKLLHRFQPNFAVLLPDTRHGWSKHAHNKLRWQTATSLENRKITISHQQFDRSTQNFAQ